MPPLLLAAAWAAGAAPGPSGVAIDLDSPEPWGWVAVGHHDARLDGVRPDARVTVTHRAGPVEVRCVDGRGVSAMSTAIVRGPRPEPLQGPAGAARVAVSGVRDQVAVRVSAPVPIPGQREILVTLVVEAPRGATLDVHAPFDAVSIEGCAGDVAVHSGHGGVQVTGNPRHLEVDATGGDVDLALDPAALSDGGAVRARDGSVVVHLRGDAPSTWTLRAPTVDLGPLGGLPRAPVPGGGGAHVAVDASREIALVRDDAEL